MRGASERDSSQHSPIESGPGEPSRPAAALLSSSSSGSSTGSSSASSAISASNYLSGLVNKSSSLLGSLKQQCTSLLLAETPASPSRQPRPSGTPAPEPPDQHKQSSCGRPKGPASQAAKSQQTIICERADTNCLSGSSGTATQMLPPMAKQQVQRATTSEAGHLANYHQRARCLAGELEPAQKANKQPQQQQQPAGEKINEQATATGASLSRHEDSAQRKNEPTKGAERFPKSAHNRDNSSSTSSGGSSGSLIAAPGRMETAGPLRSRASTMDADFGRLLDSGGQQLAQEVTTTESKKPPLPPPPPRELVEACAARNTPTHSATRPNQPPPPPSPHQRRHALQELSLERDAALSLRGAHSKEFKHKRTSSIKSALRHAHLGPLRSASSKRAAGKAAAALVAAASADAKASGGKSKSKEAAKSKPYELFEPPVTQRTFERSKRRRGAMQTDARRQMSADTIGLRQLTDEYLHNAGVRQFITTTKPGEIGGRRSEYSNSLVALSGPLSHQQAAAKPGTIAVPGGSSTVAAIAAANSASGLSSASQQAQCALEAQLFQATRQAQARLEHQKTIQSGHGEFATGSSASFSGSNNSINAGGAIGSSARYQQQLEEEDPLSQVTVLPGSLPWQCDVSIQCQLLQAPPMVEPYETTGDILNTIARPFRAPALCNNHATASMDAGSSSSHHHHHHHLSATLKRGLSAISQHHLSPVGAVSGASSSAGSMALNVVGSLKKSISNTMFDVANNSALSKAAAERPAGLAISSGPNFLRSQDSLPAYSNLLNEPDDEANSIPLDFQQAANTGNHLQAGDGQQPSLIEQLASRLGRQSSKKFTVSRKGLQRALSFDYRGYKRLDAQQQAQQQQQQNEKSQRQNTLAHSAWSTMQTSADSTSSSTGPAASQLAGSGPPNAGLQASRQKAHNKSTLALQSPRPYLPQSASQVDFQVPLLPYERMQEAIVSQRLLDPAPPSSNAAAVLAPADQLDNNEHRHSGANSNKPAGRQPDADELICGKQDSCSLNGAKPLNRDERPLGTTTSVPYRSASGRRRATPPPRLVLDSAPGQGNNGTAQGCQEDDYDEEAAANQGARQEEASVIVGSPNVVIDAAAANLLLDVAAGGQMSQSPSFCIEPDGKSASFRHRDQQQSVDGGGLLTASDVFSKSKNFIKRPSTMMAGDEGVEAMNQVVLALESKTAAMQQQQQQQERQASGQLHSSASVRSRNRRQAIVPPKLATDACTSSESESREQPECGQLVELADDQHRGSHELEPPIASGHSQRASELPASRPSGRNRPKRRAERQSDEFAAHEEAELSGIRRKRSGGGIEKTHTAPSVPTFRIEPDDPLQQATDESATLSMVARPRELDTGRADSRATNADSIVSSASSNTLSAPPGGRQSAHSGALSPTSAAGLSVPFGSGPSSSRRRSSIAVIPQMQICPGDLLVYSKQLIERMNQTDENEPPQFLTIDEKKSKNNIWSSFKLCAQFDNRTLRARNELLCSLEDVLASLQPSTFVDEQLSHYKGMVWSEFLYETESHRSGSSDNEGPTGEQEAEDKESSQANSKRSYRDDLVDVHITTHSLAETSPTKDLDSAAHRQTDSMRGHQFVASSSTSQPAGHETIKGTMSTGASGHAPPSKQAALAGPGRALSSRLREKPKLRRGQTVDSVFRIPLIPSSPLKHAQQHQQTPTAHLEDHDLNIIEDEERSSLTSATSGSQEAGVQRASLADCRASTVCRKRSSSTRSRSGSRPNQASGRVSTLNEPDQVAKQSHSQESSFEAEDTSDLLGGADGRRSRRCRPPTGSATPNQIVRQSSLSTLSSTITRTEQKRQRALWDLFQSECTFFFDHLMTLKNVYMEPLKKIQVEGFAMFADPDVLFGNLDELCCDVYDFCKEFLYIIMRTLKTRPEELNATDVLIKLYKKNPKIDHLRAVYHRYTLNYINALTYLESLRRQVEFVEFEKWSSRDVRCKKLQLTDLLVAPVQHIMRVPIILKDIEAHTENARDRDEIRAILAVEEASLRELDDKMRWLKNFERLLEIQKNISWPSVFDMEPKLYVPEFLKEVLSKQPCEKLIVSPRRQIVHEGTLTNLDLGGKTSDMHVILFDDMLLMMRRKKALTKKASTVCKTNSVGHSGHTSGSGASALRDDGTFKYIVYKQPLSLDRFYVHDVQQVDSQSVGIKHLFLLIVMNRFQQLINVHSFAAPNDDIKQTWLFKIKKTVERWKRNFSSSATNSQNTSSEQQTGNKQASSGQQVTQQPAQQQISTSKSMPMEALSRCNRPARPEPQIQETSAGIRPLPPEEVPSATVYYQSRQLARQQERQQQQPLTPIEFVITGASESPTHQQQLTSESSNNKCR